MQFGHKFGLPTSSNGFRHSETLEVVDLSRVHDVYFGKFHELTELFRIPDQKISLFGKANP